MKYCQSQENEKLTALKSFLGEMHITFEVKKPNVKKKDRPYNPKFAKMILERTESAKQEILLYMMKN